MKTTKVDIQLTPYELAPNQGPIVKFAKFNYDRSAILLTEGVTPQMIETNVDVETWEAIKVYTKTEVKYYLVKTDERELFNELLQISNDRLKRLEDEFMNKGYYLGRREGLAEAKLRIKKLPWRKRLLNKF